MTFFFYSIFYKNTKVYRNTFFISITYFSIENAAMSKNYEKKRFNVIEAINFVTSGDVSDLSDLSEDEEFDNDGTEMQLNAGNFEVLVGDESVKEKENFSDSDDEDDIPLAQLAEINATNDMTDNSKKPAEAVPSEERTYRWRKKDMLEKDVTFTSKFSDPPIDLPTPYQYFRKFFPPALDELVAEQTNLYSVQKCNRNIKTTPNEISSLIGMMMKMGIVQLPSYRLFWSQSFRYEPIAEVMPKNRFLDLLSNLHFANNLEIEKQDKLAKIRPIIDGVREECVKVEPEEYHSVDEQIIPSKTKYSSIRQYNPKKPVKWGFKNLVRAGSSGFMYDFYIYEGKGKDLEKGTPYEHLSKSAQVVARLVIHLPKLQNHKLFFDNWFSTLELIVYLCRLGIWAVGTIRSNRTAGCPVMSNKDLESQSRGAMDHRVDNNSGLIVVKWADNKIVELTSNYVGIEPVDAVDRWSKKDGSRVDVPCPQIVKQYNKAMGGVDLADMLIALYRIPARTKRWYLKIFWHMVDIAKVNAWILYKRQYQQLKEVQPNSPGKFLKLIDFSSEIASALIGANKPTPSCSRGRPAKRRSMDTSIPVKGKQPTVRLPVSDIRYDQVGHWPDPVSKKNRCRHCGMTCRMMCSKCKIYLCSQQDRNCFFNFHNPNV